MWHFSGRPSLVGLATLLLTYAAGCSVYMEATRPTPVELDEYQIGQSRDSVLERLGAPESMAKESDGASCDFYRLYTKGYGAGGKIPIAIVEGAADVFTLGLAEVVLTPAEGVTKNDKHPVAICYKDDRIVRINTDGQTSAASAQTAMTTPSPPAAPASAAASDNPVPNPAGSPAPQAAATTGVGSPPVAGADASKPPVAPGNAVPQAPNPVAALPE